MMNKMIYPAMIVRGSCNCKTIIGTENCDLESGTLLRTERIAILPSAPAPAPDWELGGGL
jgi:hypothetical protein